MKDNENELLARIAELETIKAAAEKLVRCKGRYHSEQNYRALAEMFGVTVPDLPPLDGEQTQCKPVADLYALLTLTGTVYCYTTSQYEVEQWMQMEGYKAQEYVKLERLMEIEDVGSWANNLNTPTAAPAVQAEQLFGNTEQVLVPVPDEFLSSEQNSNGMFELSEDCMCRLSVALSQQSKGLVIPPGYALVPEEPTREMSDAVAALYRKGFMDERIIRQTYRAYLDNAPLPDKDGEQ